MPGHRTQTADYPESISIPYRSTNNSPRYAIKTSVAALASVVIITTTIAGYSATKEPLKPAIPSATKSLAIERTLKDAKGRQIEVTVLENTATEIKCRRKSDGMEFTIALDKLSADDQKFFAELNQPKKTVQIQITPSETQTGQTTPNPAVATPPPNRTTLQGLNTKEIFTAPDGSYLGTRNDVFASTRYPGNATITWDRFFTDKACWNELPEGQWMLESRTATVLQYAAVKHRTFMGSTEPDYTLARIHVNSKTGAVIFAELRWRIIYSEGFTPDPK